jgi:hypothetical protein
VNDLESAAAPRVGDEAALRQMTVQTSTSYVYDPAVVEELYERLKPDPDLYGEDHVYAVWSVLNGSLAADDVFDDRSSFDQWCDADVEYDPDA